MAELVVGLVAEQAINASVSILSAILSEFRNLDKQDAAAMDIAGRLASLKPALDKWCADKNSWPADRSKSVQARAVIYSPSNPLWPVPFPYQGHVATLVRFDEDRTRHQQSDVWEIEVSVNGAQRIPMWMDVRCLKPVLSGQEAILTERLTRNLGSIQGWLQDYYTEV